MRYNGYMKLLAHRELRNYSGRVLREAEAGERFVVTVDCRPAVTLGAARGPSVHPQVRNTWHILRQQHS